MVLNIPANANSAASSAESGSFANGTMLLVLPTPFRHRGNELLLEAQASNGLNRWAEHFSQVVVAAPIIPEQLALADNAVAWEKADVLSSGVRCITLPWAYSPFVFAREYLRYRKLLSAEIRRCEFLQFAIGGLWGDWAAVAATEARRQGRDYAIHTDRVESQLIRKLTQGQSNLRAWKRRLEAALMDRYHRDIINGCALGLWHGRECYDAYSKWCPNNHLIHDVHTKKSDAISASSLARKLHEVADSSPLRIAYAGRMVAMKAPLEWVKAIGRARDLGVKLEATWYGDGELRPEVETLIRSLRLEQEIHLAGFISDRSVLLEEMRRAHLLLFTHVTPESPRCLLEALICGASIIGYQNPFAEDLTAEFGGGCFVPIHQWEQLGGLLATLSANRPQLQRLISDAAQNGSRFNDEQLFGERSRLIKSMAQPPSAGPLHGLHANEGSR